jgi:hypothetical protein
VDRDDLVAALEEVARHAVRVPVGLGGEAHDRDAADAPQQPTDRVVVRVREGLHSSLRGSSGSVLFVLFEIPLTDS